ncbi:alpha-N-acetylglucosaminidase C-terminal domain-containing protein [Microbacterium sp. Sa4CUA7]|uniref:Alpha-N-acetylglucosaminidase C-terminal domain-containing protein n=1 Tax=Microbacterium pullorum TaxID=2762236 RepID=A0ABR8S5E6_9MICO|nr:alpha-N-acetylglucosaminidase TIM-barrel domain-containing protein [Microbacterium pullorum]MBD7958692.1 alpha-N-acetylglucosaminidase C-terminal domain-containing protein [Microbacterium pullorum]
MTEHDEFVEAIGGIVERLGGDATRVRAVRLEPSDDAAACGTYAAADGVLTLGGTDVVAAASALARYLQVNGRRITWETPLLQPAFEAWPDAAHTAIRTPFTVRYYLNVVTHGYSTAYWDWQRWERELDWMALHGITHPLILTAYEVVLEETLRRSGVPAVQARAWVGSAAHTPWMSMGGMHDFGGPLPAHWAQRRVDLARRILGRAREFGMTPVLPLTGGHVPASLAGDGAPQIEWQGWRTPMLEPSSVAYADLVRTFLEVQREYLGDPGPHPVIAVDPYIESLPPRGDEEALAAAGRGIHRAIAAVHPGATWLLQGWPFHYHRDFWTPQRVSAYLSDVPHERLLLIDLWGEHAPMWREGMHGRRWLWSAIHNFGGRFALFGDLEGLAADVAELRALRPERLEGIGLAPEAIENNTVFYELATDLVWDTVDPAEWLDSFAVQRYGVSDERARQVWRLLAATLYGPGRTRSIPSPVFARPWSATAPFAAQRLAGEALPTEPARMSANIDAENDPTVQEDLPRIARAARLLLEVTDAAAHTAALERDLVDLTGHLIAQRTREHIRGILEASGRHDAPAIGAHAARLRAALLDLDALAATCPESRVSTWIDAARAWADDATEAAAMEHDARSLVSVWGHQTSGLHDYSGRHWSGLVRDLYLPRWEAWAQWLAQAAEHQTEPDVAVFRDRIVAIEEKWRAAVGSDDRSDASPSVVAAAALDRVGY